ncbi:hypothetical protein PUN28_000679 [Cardiocondyla obscurior]|uniref:Uncharacterized protein n=1 Tax=Cardiocondyla obscurior TaxID=286306 RepID=A0AAW2H0I0_9HYME
MRFVARRCATVLFSQTFPRSRYRSLARILIPFRLERRKAHKIACSSGRLDVKQHKKKNFCVKSRSFSRSDMRKERHDRSGSRNDYSKIKFRKKKKKKERYL